MTLRPLRERVLQTATLEFGALFLISPLYSTIFGAGIAESAGLIAAISVSVLMFSPVYNHLFDLVEWRLCRRLASDRLQPCRLLHAAGHEIGSMIVTVPVILALTDHRLGVAIGLDIGLSLFYTGYVWLFCMVYDRLRPVQSRVVRHHP